MWTVVCAGKLESNNRLCSNEWQPRLPATVAPLQNTEKIAKRKHTTQHANIRKRRATQDELRHRAYLKFNANAIMQARMDRRNAQAKL